MSDPTNGGRERAYKELRESEELHRATLESISDAVFLTNDQDHFTFVCPNVDVIFGYSPDEVHTMSRINVLLGDNLFDHADLVARGEIRNIERDVTAKSGSRRTVLVHVKSVSISGSTVLYCCRDITELKHAEEDLRVLRSELAHSTRLALVGQLMASITHEVKQADDVSFSHTGSPAAFAPDGAGAGRVHDHRRRRAVHARQPRSHRRARLYSLLAGRPRRDRPA